MAYYDALIAKWATLSGTTAQKLAALNVLTVAGPSQDVPVEAAIGYLALGLKLDALMNYAAAAPIKGATTAQLAARNLSRQFTLPNTPPFGTSNPTVYASLSAALNAIASDPASGITSSDVTALLALAATNVPWWQSAGYTSSIGPSDLQAAGGLT